MIDSQQASKALAEINEIARRVRQSRIYNLASLLMIMWGGLVLAANVASFAWPRHAGYIWIAANAMGVAGSFAVSAFTYSRTGVRTFDLRMLTAFLLFFAFGVATCALGHFGPRELGTFWPIYFMLFYTIAGLWVGVAFVVIGLSISALTLIGYFFVGPWFEPWMAVVNGGGLMLGGLWMRRN
ncbi:hypothetical protein KMZ29_22640 [Bradyrhizobium sediminis]|uniref:Uncharacterized protein n=1 Tax=Bradyrhizobium sediminis TaxID=2840469 RepID=A0A975NDE7_9BRAD|nr:hypothetical protein [Bradyrhizobium sediminis]QWG12471.1 hypothetical protein KMZ29_22640 [Bradyrhizobium sediminis]